MKKWRIILIALIGTLQLSAFAAPKEKKEKAIESQRVYMFGVGIDFNDSTIYLTDVQHLDSIVVNSDKSIQNQVNYSLQLKVYLEGILGENDQTCAVIYSPKKRKLEKRFIKMRKRYQADESKILKQIGTDAFTFQKR